MDGSVSGDRAACRSHVTGDVRTSFTKYVCLATMDEIDWILDTRHIAVGLGYRL